METSDSEAGRSRTQRQAPAPGEPRRCLPSAIDALARRGHAIDRWDGWNEMAGDAHGITIDRQNGMLSGGSDPRSDEAAIGSGTAIGTPRQASGSIKIAFHARGDKGSFSQRFSTTPTALSRKTLAGLKGTLRGVRFVSNRTGATDGRAGHWRCRR